MASEKKKKKKETVNVTLPKAKASLKRQAEMKDMKAQYQDVWKAIGVIILILLILFVVLGGVSQVGIWNGIKEWARGIGESISNWFSGGDVIVNNDGIYWVP
jgi:hypothetical protein